MFDEYMGQVHEQRHDAYAERLFADPVFAVFGTATVVTTKGKQIFTARVQTTAPGAGSVTPPAIGANPPKNLAIGVGATTATRTAVAGDTSLSQEMEARVAGAETVTTNVYQVVGTITNTSAGVEANDEAGLFDTSATTTSSGASAAATTLPLASGVFQATGTLYALNRTTPANGAQTITVSAGGNTTSATVTALTGAVTSGDRISQGNMFASATYAVQNLQIGDSTQLTWQITVA